MGIPKAEQHTHHVGSMPIDLSKRLAAKHGLRSVDSYDFTGKGLAGFVGTYVEVCGVLRDPDDYRELAIRISHDQRAQNTLYSRVHYTPAIAGSNGTWSEPLAALLEGFREAHARGGALVHLILDIPAQFDDLFPGHDFREQTLALAIENKVADVRVPGVVGIGVAGNEARTDWPSYRSMLAGGRAVGLDVVLHAGESQGPERLREAIDLLGEPPDRIEHGIAAALDAALVAELAASDIALDIAITSNFVLENLLALGMTAHPFLDLMNAGLTITLNTDDPAMFQTDLCNEYASAHLLGAELSQLQVLAANAWNDRFIPAELRETALQQIKDPAPPSDEASLRYLDFARTNATTSVLPHD